MRTSLFWLALLFLLGSLNFTYSQQASISQPVLPCTISVEKRSTNKTKQARLSPIDYGISSESVEYIAKSMDFDCDGISNYYDKCLDFASKNNRDSDGDGFGDACDKVSSDVSIAIKAARTQIRKGKNINFSIFITNYGPKEPAGILEIFSYFSPTVRIDSVDSPENNCEAFENEIGCEIERLVVGSTIKISVSATAIKTGRFTTIATVSNGIGDLHRRNNKARLFGYVTR